MEFGFLWSSLYRVTCEIQLKAMSDQVYNYTHKQETCPCTTLGSNPYGKSHKNLTAFL